MTIATFDQYLEGAKQKINWSKLVSRVTLATGWFSVHDLAGQPGAGVLAGTSVAAGVVPVDTDNGYPLINSFGGLKGYIGRTEVSGTAIGRFAWSDRLWLGGAYPFNASQALAGQPSFAARLPNTDYTGLQIWVETVTAFTGNPVWTVTYTNAAGTAGQVTSTPPAAVGPTLGRCFQLALAAGDNGVQKITNVVCTGASAGTFNVMILRPLFADRVPVANEMSIKTAIDNGFPEIFDTSALFPLMAMDTTSTGIPECSIQIVSG